MRAPSARLRSNSKSLPWTSHLYGTNNSSVLVASVTVFSHLFSLSAVHTNASKGKTSPSLDPAYELSLPFESLAQIPAALVVLQCLHVDVLFCFVFSHNFSICSQRKSVKTLCILRSCISLQFGFLGLIYEIINRSVLCRSAINIRPVYHWPFTPSARHIPLYVSWEYHAMAGQMPCCCTSVLCLHISVIRLARYLT